MAGGFSPFRRGDPLRGRQFLECSGSLLFGNAKSKSSVLEEASLVPFGCHLFRDHVRAGIVAYRGLLHSGVDQRLYTRSLSFQNEKKRRLFEMADFFRVRLAAPPLEQLIVQIEHLCENCLVRYSRRSLCGGYLFSF